MQKEKRELEIEKQTNTTHCKNNNNDDDDDEKTKKGIINSRDPGFLVQDPPSLHVLTARLFGCAACAIERKC